MQAIVDGDDCSVAINTRADTVASCAGECAGNNKKCGGKNFPRVLGCCNDDYLCVKKNNSYMACRRNGTPRNSDWDGTIVPCSK